MQFRAARSFLPASLAALALALPGCARDGELDISNGVGVSVTRSGCPAVAVPAGLGDVTLFDPATSRDAGAIDIVATLTKLRPGCNEAGAKIYSVADFEVQARRSNPRGSRKVTLPYFSVVTQGGSAVVAKRVGQVTLNFADGEARATATGRAAAYVDASAARLPDDIRRRITQERKAGDTDAALDPLADPAVRAAVARASFELLVGFQLSEDQLRYNVTR